MSSSVEIKVDDVWSLILRRLISLEEADQRPRVHHSRYGPFTRIGPVDMQSRPGQQYRYILRKKGRDYRSYETSRELFDASRRFLSQKKLDTLAREVASVLRLEFTEDDLETGEDQKGIPHWL